GEQGPTRRPLDDPDREDEAPIGEPVDPQFPGDIEPRVLVEEGDSELDVQQLFGKPEGEHRDSGAGAQHRQGMGEETVGELAPVLFALDVVTYDPSSDRD